MDESQDEICSGRESPSVDKLKMPNGVLAEEKAIISDDKVETLQQINCEVENNCNTTNCDGDDTGEIGETVAARDEAFHEGGEEILKPLQIDLENLNLNLDNFDIPR